MDLLALQINAKNGGVNPAGYVPKFTALDNFKKNTNYQLAKGEVEN